MDDLRVSKGRIAVDVKLGDRPPERMEIFLAASAEHHHGAEHVDDVLNGRGAFVPVMAPGSGVHFVNRAQICWVRLPPSPETEPELASGSAYEVRIQLTTGEKLEGVVEVQGQPDHSRLLDLLNDGAHFFKLAAPVGTFLVSKQFVAQMEFASP